VLDADSSGHITSGEFGSFMRRGEHVHERQVPGRDKIHTQRVNKAAELRAQKSSSRGEALKADVARASDDEVRSLAQKLSSKLAELVEPPATPSWFKLFRHIDDNGSGLISFAEFSDMIRDELQLLPSDVPNRTLKAVWVALDADSSGVVSYGEFGRFMREGETVLDKPAQARVGLVTRRQQEAAALRAQRDKMFHRDLKAAMANKPRASDEDIALLSRRLNKRLRELVKPPATPSWFKLFRHMDDDGSGKISFAEFSGMIRDELRLLPSDVPNRTLKAVWVALDADSSGLLTSGEFGAFMRKGEAELLKESDSRSERSSRPRTSSPSRFGNSTHAAPSEATSARPGFDVDGLRGAAAEAQLIEENIMRYNSQAAGLAAELVKLKGPEWRPSILSEGLNVPPSSLTPRACRVAAASRSTCASIDAVRPSSAAARTSAPVNEALEVALQEMTARANAVVAKVSDGFALSAVEMEQLRTAQVREQAIDLVGAVEHGHVLSPREMETLHEAAGAERKARMATLRAEITQAHSELAGDLRRGARSLARSPKHPISMRPNSISRSPYVASPADRGQYIYQASSIGGHRGPPGPRRSVPVRGKT